MAGFVSWLAIFSVVLVAGATPSINNGSTAIIIVNNSITTTHRPNLTLPDVLNNTTAAAIIKNSTVTLPAALNSITAGAVIMPPSPAIKLRGNNIDTASTTNETYVNTTIYMEKYGILKVIIPSLFSFAGAALMVFLWWSSLRARLVGVDDMPPIASLIAGPTPSAIDPIVELVNRSLQNQPPPPPPPATTDGDKTKK